ncbi:unnamed protein product, partial [Symbiodinium sp. KB8]
VEECARQTVRGGSCVEEQQPRDGQRREESFVLVRESLQVLGDELRLTDTREADESSPKLASTFAELRGDPEQAAGLRKDIRSYKRVKVRQRCSIAQSGVSARLQPCVGGAGGAERDCVQQHWDVACPARDFALLPAYLGGLGLAQAVRTAPAGPHAGAWLTAIPSATAPAAVGTGLEVKRLAADSVRTHLVATLARRTNAVEWVWCRVAPMARTHDRAVGSTLTPLGGAICCDATLVSPLRRDGTPHARAPSRDGAALQVAERRKRAIYPELAQGGAQSLCVLGREIGGHWNASAMSLVRRLVALRSCRAPPAARGPAHAAWARRWWSVLSTAVQQATGHTALGRAGVGRRRVLALAPADPSASFRCADMR